jgi:hypothetical protein
VQEGEKFSQYAKDILREMEVLRLELPSKDFIKDARELEKTMKELEKAYNRREKVIDRIMEAGTGFESREALRMFSTPLLEKWADDLESSEARMIPKRSPSSKKDDQLKAVESQIRPKPGV